MHRSYGPTHNQGGYGFTAPEQDYHVRAHCRRGLVDIDEAFAAFKGGSAYQSRLSLAAKPKLRIGVIGDKRVPFQSSRTHPDPTLVGWGEV